MRGQMAPPPGMVVRAFAPEDLLLLQPQAAQLAELPAEQRLEMGYRFAESGGAFTLWLTEADAPRPIFCGGHVRMNRHYAALWGWFSTEHRRARVFLTRTIRRYVAELQARRIEAQAWASNGPACRWAEAIGLAEETRHRAAAPDGSDIVFFVNPKLLEGAA